MTAILALGLMSPVPAAAQTTALVLDSQPGDFIGGGVDRTFTQADGSFTAFHNFDNGVSVFFNGGASGTWSLNFAAPQGVPLTVGVYENATRWPFQPTTHPGLSISGEGRGCNTLTGRFEVLEVVYGAGSAVERFAATFEQHCHGGVPALLGSILLNSTLPPPPPPPSRCVPTVATIPDLLAQVNVIPTSTTTLVTVSEPLLAAQWAANNGFARLARWMMGRFITQAANFSNLQPTDPNGIQIATANKLVCAASNVLTNITIP